MKTTILSAITFLILCFSAFAEPRHYIAKLTGDGQGNVSVTVLFNSFTQPFTWEETAVGEYRGTCSQTDALPAGRVMPFDWIRADNGTASTIAELDEHRIIVYQKDGLGGSPQYGPEILVEISVFPE